jgi:hypothetical protein
VSFFHPLASDEAVLGGEVWEKARAVNEMIIVNKISGLIILKRIFDL